MRTPQDTTPRMTRPQTLDDLLLYGLSRLQASAGGIVVRYCEGRFGITRREWRILAVLAAYGEAGSSELARHAELDRPRTSRAISALEAKKLVARTSRGGDARHVSVALTQEGERLYREIFPVVSGINLQILEVLSRDEVLLLENMLARMRARADELAAREDLPLADRRHGGSQRHLRP